jgi:Spy/CpxP family protein refolding chaperone
VNAWKVIFSTLVIFIAGVVTGGLLVNYTVRIQESQRSKPPNSAAATNPWILRSHDLLKRMDRELDLTPEQHARIDDILKQSQERMRIIFRQVSPQMNRETQQVRAQIVKELTPEQRKKFEGLTRNRPGMGKLRNGTNSLTNAPTNGIGTNIIATNTAP